MKVKSVDKYAYITAVFLCGFTFSSIASASETKSSITLMPAKYASVKGDAAKFRAQHWMTDGYSSGIKNLSITKEEGDNYYEFEGSGIPEQNEYEAAFNIRNEKIGYIKTDYNIFRKYYDPTGGFYRPFSTLQVNDTSQDLHMDIGHLSLEMGIAKDDFPDLSVQFERHTKNGEKSRLTWTPVKVGAVTREIGPSWQDIDEIADSIAFRGNGEIGGFNVKGEQKWEFVTTSARRLENFLSNSGVAADTKYRVQNQEPESDLMTSTLRGDKWFLNDKNYVSMGYRYSKMQNSEAETIQEYDANGVPRSFSNPKNILYAQANNEYDNHSWISSFVSNISPALNFISKFKTELLNKHGNSIYPGDSTDPPDGIPNTTEVSTVKNKITRMGENFSLRYSGIPKTSLYSEVELEQNRNYLVEDRFSVAGQSASNSNEIFNRGTLTNVQKRNFTLGAHYAPISTVDTTTQVRHKIENNDFDDQYESVASGTAKSAFFDALNIVGDEVSTRLTWRPLQWVEGGFRYQYLNNQYLPRVENEVKQRSRLLSNVFTYDTTLNPMENVFLTMSYSQQFNKTSTPAASNATNTTPAFNSNVNSWLMSTSYTPKENLSFTNSFQYSRSRNFDNLSNYTLGLPLGADYDQYDTSIGLEWSPKKDLKVSPNYMYTSYQANPDTDNSDYSAHVIWLDLSLNW